MISLATVVSAAHPSPLTDNYFIAPRQVQLSSEGNQTASPKACLKDANAGDNSCGPKAGATCTGSSGLGACCGEWGWCGNSADHCGKKMQADYSHGKGLCTDSGSYTGRAVHGAEVDRSQCHCGADCQGLTMEDVAETWTAAIWPLNQDDAVKMCVPALAIASGASFDQPGCAGMYHPRVSGGESETPIKGIWQIGHGFDPDPAIQAKVVYEVYTSNNPDRGCLAQWCQDSGCSKVIQGIGQDEETAKRHRFCEGAWTQGTEAIQESVAMAGGMKAIERACEFAAERHRKAGTSNKAKEPKLAPKPAPTTIDRSKCHCGEECKGLTVEDLAKTWVEAIWPFSREDAVAMCLPALAVAAGSSFGLENCAGMFHPRAKGEEGGPKGLWQINNGYNTDPAKQALSVYQIYTSNNTDYGCLSQWCKTSKCGIALPGIGQDGDPAFQHHLFCQGAWTGDPELYQRGLESIGGRDEVHRICSAAGEHNKAKHAAHAEANSVYGEAEREIAEANRGDKGQENSVYGEASGEGKAKIVVVDDGTPDGFKHRLKVLAMASLSMA